ncbi:hypothetical protein A5886_000708 [Enterococcus sp. 8G7_MSG3316]|uniref:Permease IIC component n=1 Tax=Candidatus Enterococcus testudinis TaxID=1834191 RepID=A0A242A4V0_9ENTE|nr:PTS transporter subunit EIIC [Enterococcus sp. 8G7_MSG3316]OTN75633.1 hypothetical protein A5886_000708 [Enterococcus sp. 8G7_MSG3316]
MGQFNTVLNEQIMPVMGKISQNKVIRAIQYGAMSTMPLTLGVSLIAILVNLPVESWTTWLASSGIDVHMRATIKVTMEITALYMTFMIGYHNSNERNTSPITGGILSLASFFILMPQVIPYEGGEVAGLNFDYIGSNGIFGGMIVAILVSSLYSALDKKGLVVKLPDSVPPMVSQSLSPTFIAIIIFVLVFFSRVGFSFTQWEDYFGFINGVIGAPIMNLGASPISAITFMTIVSLFWFFGIHPNTVTSIYLPVLMSTGVANLTAFMAGEPMPYLAFSATLAFFSLGGAGNTLGIALLIPFISKSNRYKSLGKLSFGPAIFNINEPLVFGLPLMLNPLFFIPMVGTALINGMIGFIGYNIGIYDTLNPSISLPWITPAFIGPILTVGIKGVLLALFTILINALLYLPFFIKADKLALLEEKAADVAANESQITEAA